MDAWAARIAAAGVFFAEALAAVDVNAEMLALECSIGGQAASAPFKVDLTNRTIDTGKGLIPVEVNSHAISWHEESVLRTINGGTRAVFRRLPDGARIFRSDVPTVEGIAAPVSAPGSSRQRSMLGGDKNVLKCPCHNSEFDPRRIRPSTRCAGRVWARPRGLAALPLAIADDALIVAASFIGKVGSQP